MVSSVCRGSYPSMTPHASPTRKPRIDPQKDYFSPLQVETSVEYDLPAHIYPPKDSEPILMIHPAYVSAVRARSRAVVTPSPTAMVATSGAARPLAPLQLPQQQQQLQQGSGVTRSSSSSLSSSSSSSLSSLSSSKSSSSSVVHPRTWCTCGNPNCNPNSVKALGSVVVQQSVATTAGVSTTTIVQNASARSVPSQNNNPRGASVVVGVPQSMKSVQSHNNNLGGSGVVSSARDHVTLLRSGPVLLQPQKQQQQPPPPPPQQQQPQMVLGNGGRCLGPCCNPRAGAMAPLQAEFVAPGLPPSLLARTPTRGTAGGSPKLRAARTRRGLSVASSVNLPDYLGNSRPARVTGGAVHAHPRPRALSTSMGALAATPAPPMAHQHIGMGASLTTSLDLARAHPLTPRSLMPVQQQQQQQQQQPPPQPSQAVTSSTSSLLYTVGLSRDSGCSVGAETSGGEWAVERTRGLVDSGFCTPVDLTDDFIADTLSWKEPSTPLSSSMTSSSSSSNNSNSISSSSNIVSSSSNSSSGGVHTFSLLPGAGHSHHYLPQPLWNLAY